MTIQAITIQAKPPARVNGHNYIGHNYIGHNYTGHNPLPGSMGFWRLTQSINLNRLKAPLIGLGSSKNNRLKAPLIGLGPSKNNRLKAPLIGLGPSKNMRRITVLPSRRRSHWSARPYSSTRASPTHRASRARRAEPRLKKKVWPGPVTTSAVPMGNSKH